jgi:hypothetical protein
MTTYTPHPLAAEYLKRLRRAARVLPAERRAELVAEIESHLAEALEPWVPDPEARGVLERLGSPETIVEAEQPGAAEPPDARGRRELVAIFLLLFGGLLAGVGWIIGVVLLWSSTAWTRREKWIGTLAVPFGLALPFFILALSGVSSESCSAGSERCATTAPTSGQVIWMGIVTVLVLASIASSRLLWLRARVAPG